MTSKTARFQQLPQLDGRLFLTDGGLETTLIFHEGWDLPMGEAFVLCESDRGREALRAYFDRYLPLAIEHGAGFILESPTWRANPDWGAKAGYGLDRLAEANRAGITLMQEIRDAYETPATPIVVSGCIGPRGDGYDPGTLMGVEQAEFYHAWQVNIFSDVGADCVAAITMTNVNEAIGVARAAKAAGIPSVISFTLETDGRLPTGEKLSDAIEAVDRATDKSPAYYMINCAHPTHFSGALEDGAPWVLRLRGLRANSSCLSHAELDESPELDTGNPQELGVQYAELLRRFPHVNVLGGCCGTDHRHVACIGQACCGIAAPGSEATAA
jgi:S-methylmethionine-dependent homocysteine/selenocysteine methylase